MLADILLTELQKHEADFAPAHQHIVMIARDIAAKYKEQQETLASIATLYVRTAHELRDLQEVRSR